MSQAGQYLPPGAASGITTLKGDLGGKVSPDILGDIEIVGSGNITVTGNNALHKLVISSSGGGSSFAWSIIPGASQQMVVDNGYVANNAGTCILTLPAVATVGQTVRVSGMNNNTGWKIAQNAGQTIHMLTADTTTGVAGYLASSSKRDSVEVVCIIANTDWQVVSSMGNITYA